MEYGVSIQVIFIFVYGLNLLAIYTCLGNPSPVYAESSGMVCFRCASWSAYTRTVLKMLLSKPVVGLQRHDDKF